MPSIVTHHFFAKDASSFFKENNISIEKNTYFIFAQSFDNLFYYNLLNLKKGSHIRELGNTAQQSQCDIYFLNILKHIKKNHLEHNPEVLAYLYGSLTHYILDSTIHPFVIYHAGYITKENKNYQYRGNHESIEVNIDVILYEERTNQILYEQKLANQLLPNITFSNTLIELINKVFQDTFKVNKIGKIYNECVKQGHFIHKYFVTDRTGIKKFSYQIFDNIVKNNTLMYHNLCFHIKRPNRKYLNEEKHNWYYPTNPQIKRNDSFWELYNLSLNKINLIFSKTNDYLNNIITLKEYKQFLGRNSYTTGLDWKEKKEPFYFQN